MTKGTELIRFTARSTPRDAESIVSLLETSGGNLRTFLDNCSNEGMDDELVIATVENWLNRQKDKSFIRRWNDAIKSNQVVRLKLLQHRTLERMEFMSNAGSWLELAKEATAHKMILADLLAGQTFSAKQKPQELKTEEEDDEELAEVMNNA